MIKLRKFPFLLSLLIAQSACMDATPAQHFSEEQRNDAVTLATLCALEKAVSYAKQQGNPTELGMLAARSCREDITLSAFVYADGNGRRAAELLPHIMQSTAEIAALQIVKERAS